jgi:hypothetical protein
MAAAADVPPAQAPGHAVGARQVLAVAAKALGLHAEAVQLEPLPGQCSHDRPDFLGRLPTADRAHADQWRRCQVDSGRVIQGSTFQVVSQLPALEDRDKR